MCIAKIIDNNDTFVYKDKGFCKNKGEEKT